MNAEPTPRVRPGRETSFGLRKCDPSKLSTGYGKASKMTPMFCQDGYGLDILPLLWVGVLLYALSPLSARNLEMVRKRTKFD
jgi:hypothetical protein